MNFKMMGRLMGIILAAETVFMIPALLLSLRDGDTAAVGGFLWAMGGALLTGGLLWLYGRRASREFYAREGLVCVGLSWILLSLFGCLPFLLSGAIPRFADALFETVSGFSTTGASILSDVEVLPRGLLYWRSFSHWLGGMGVLVFILAVMPGSRENGFTMHLLRAESPGPNVGKLVPRMRQTALLLYLIYILLTVLDTAFLLFGGMSLFEAVCTAFGTAGTGGFGIKNDSIAGFSPYIQNVCTVFMLLFGVNFSCYYFLLLRRFKSVLKDEELHMYLGIVLVSAGVMVWNIRPLYQSFGETLRHAFFQTASIVTTTGYSTTDFDLWPSLSKAVIVCLMVCGACAGSTGGGMKCGRLLLLLKALRRNIRKALNPRRVETVRVNGQPIDEGVLENTTVYLVAYVVILMASFLFISIDGFSTTTNFTAVLSCFNNIGPGLEAVGPTCNFAGYSAFSKLVLIVDMLAGRLEIFPILVLFSRGTWKAR